MTRFLVKETADGTSLEAENVTFKELQAEFPNRMFSRPLVQKQFEGTRFSVVEMPAKPLVPFGHTIEPQFSKDGQGAWIGTWNITTEKTLGQLKADLARQALELAARKVFAEWSPSIAQYTNAGRDLDTMIEARKAAINTKLDQVITDIEAAATFDEAYAIYEQLVNA